MREIMLIRIGLFPLGVDIGRVNAVQRYVDIEIIPASEDNESGCAAVRFHDGAELPLYDIHRGLHREYLPNDMPTEWQPVKVLRLSTGKSEFALGVDDVERVVEAAADAIEPMPSVFDHPSVDWFPEVLRMNDRLLLLLNPSGILDADMSARYIQKECTLIDLPPAKTGDDGTNTFLAAPETSTDIKSDMLQAIDNLFDSDLFDNDLFNNTDDDILDLNDAGAAVPETKTPLHTAQMPDTDDDGDGEVIPELPPDLPVDATSEPTLMIDDIPGDGDTAAASENRDGKGAVQETVAAAFWDEEAMPDTSSETDGDALLGRNINNADEIDTDDEIIELTDMFTG